MSAREPRFEIVRTNAGWHARFRAANGRIVWTTEVYKLRRNAFNAVELICDSAITTSPFADWPEIVWGHQGHPLEVRDIDSRYVPPPVVLEPPFRYTKAGGFWHDADYHHRNCYDEDCAEGTPPAGAEVYGRMGSAVPR